MKSIITLLLFFVIILISFGTVFVYTSSYYYSLIKFNDTSFIFLNHLVKVFLSLGVLLLFAYIPEKFYLEYSKYALLFSIMLLVIASFSHGEIKGTHRWLSLGFTTIQPAEFAKIFLIVHLSKMIYFFDNSHLDLNSNFYYPLVWIGLVSGLVLILPDMTNSTIILYISFSLLFYSGISLKPIVTIITTSFLLTSVAILAFQASRIRVLNYLESITNSNIDLNAQIHQSVIGIGSGGLFGVGLGNSYQRNLFLPEAYSNYIFSIISEEMGFIGSILIVIIFLIIFFLCLVLSNKANNFFSSLVIFGLGVNIIITAFYHIAVVIGFIPIMDIPLPFVSYGSSSLLIFCISIGIIISLSKTKTESRNVL